MCRGNKNDCCLYLKGSQGAGKSSFSDFLRDDIIGAALSIQTGSSPLKSKFNGELSGKLLV